jgi:DNA polymerase
VRIYREENDKIIKLWSECDKALTHIAEGKEEGIWLGKHKCLWVTKEGIQLPNDLYIRYPDLKWDTTEAKGRHVYKSRKGAVDIWGGSVVENVVQALARIIVGEQMIAVNEKYPVVLTVHDAAVCVVHEQEIEQAMEFITATMSTPPDWAKGLPVACEANYARSYGDC